MLPGLELITGGMLWLAAGGVQCTVPQAPVIRVTPVTKDIEYDFSRSQEELGKVKTQTLNPYDPGADTTTGGLRHDQPRTKLQVKIAYREYSSGVVCLAYDSVTFDIELAPKIYVAKEQSAGKCREAILEHERRHVKVDREVINKYAQEIGKSIQAAVNQAGAVGPYDKADLEKMKSMLVRHVETAVHAKQLMLESEMTRRQAEVDSLEEYTRVSEICNGAADDD